MLKSFLFILCFYFVNNVYAQGIPLVLGSVVEIGNDLSRITPFAGVWINGLGFARIGVSAYNKKEFDKTEAAIENEEKNFDISVQIGFSAIGPERPYIAASYVRSKAFYADWNEWGVGIGHRFSLSPLAAIVVEAEHRWISEYYDTVKKLNVSERRLQMNFGFIVYPF